MEVRGLHCVAAGHLQANPVQGARRPRRPTACSANGLTRHEITDRLQGARDRNGHVYVCASLLALNGLRVSELCALNIEGRGEAAWHHTLTVRASTTKGNKPAVVALAPRTAQAPQHAVGEREAGPLLINRTRCRMTPYNVQSLVRRLCQNIGIHQRITPHSLRHSAITMALDAGVGLRDVQDFARHEDPKTSRRYDRVRNQLNHHRPIPGRGKLTPTPPHTMTATWTRLPCALWPYAPRSGLASSALAGKGRVGGREERGSVWAGRS